MNDAVKIKGLHRSTVIRLLAACTILFHITASADPRKAGRGAAAFPAPVSYVHFFDWFGEEAWREREFVDPLDWRILGLPEDAAADRDENFYYQQFKYIRGLGIDAIAWEYHPQRGKPPKIPPTEALSAARKAGLKMAPFYDLEIAFKVRLQGEEHGLATLSNPDAIKPASETVRFMHDDLRQFYAAVPKELQAVDGEGRSVIFVFGYGFDDSSGDPADWKRFGEELVSAVRAAVGHPPRFYWTCINKRFAEHLFLHHRESFAPFHFVVDTPQSQFGHSIVTWNFGFDNLGVQKRDNLLRVIRLDPRYVEEPAWLAAATNPEAIFIYSWNEPFEGSFLFPSKIWGETKPKLAQYYLSNLRRMQGERLPATLAIVDDIDELSTTRQNDWHLALLRETLLYPLRRFAPQADVRMPHEIDDQLLRGYEIVIDLTSRKDPRVTELLLSQLSLHRTLIFDPLGWSNGSKLASLFAQRIRGMPLNRELAVSEMGSKFFARDDVAALEPCAICSVPIKADLPAGTDAAAAQLPLVITRYDDVFVNAFPANEDVLAAAFGAIYGRPMNKSILYGEGLATQRLEIEPQTHSVKLNRLSRWSVNKRWPIPDNFDWYRLPKEIDPLYFNFIFGIEQ